MQLEREILLQEEIAQLKNRVDELARELHEALEVLYPSEKFPLNPQISEDQIPKFDNDWNKI